MNVINVHLTESEIQELIHKGKTEVEIDVSCDTCSETQTICIQLWNN